MVMVVVLQKVWNRGCPCYLFIDKAMTCHSDVAASRVLLRSPGSLPPHPDDDKALQDTYAPEYPHHDQRRQRNVPLLAYFRDLSCKFFRHSQRYDVLYGIFLHLRQPSGVDITVVLLLLDITRKAIDLKLII